MFVAGLLVALISSLGCVDPAPDPTLERLETAGLGLEVLVREAEEWVRAERQAHRPEAQRLTETQRSLFLPYFSQQLLERVRVRKVARLENPGFFDRFVEAGEPLPMDFRQASGLALGDTLLLVRSRAPEGSLDWMPLLFHELVHAAQDSYLGSESYMESYVRGWAANGFAYRSIPHEAQAYELAERFRRERRPFSVEAEIERRFGTPGSR